jgi:molybdate/tungstate transport system ATP-binding protein
MIRLEKLSVCAGLFALDDISFEVPSGQHAFLMGKTGSGKTTLIEAICGLKRVPHGRIFLRGTEVTHLTPAARGIGFVPQDGALFNTLSVREHLAFALRVRKWSQRAIAKRVTELADWLQLRPLLVRKPEGLSGGEIQRVALGRALAFGPDVLCLDEPLSALDDDTRAEMLAILRSVRQRTGATILQVSHNLAEAGQLADQIVWLEAGKIRVESPDKNAS